MKNKYILERLPSLREGRYIVKVPPGFPGTKYDGKYTYEHRAVFWLHHGYLPPKGWAIHHINHDKKDNRIENLEALTLSEHSKGKHNGGKDPKPYVDLNCYYCKKIFTQEAQSYNFRALRGQTKFYCSKRCQVIERNHNRVGAKNNYPKNRKSFSPTIDLNCPCCKQTFTLFEREVRSRLNAGTKEIHCSRKCADKKNGRKVAKEKL